MSKLTEPSNCLPLINTIGLFFQILDDHLNLSPAYTGAKGLCEDLTEGKFSFPVIHAIRSDPSNLTLINILRQKTQDDDVKRYAVTYLEKTGSFEYSKKCIMQLQQKALTYVVELEGAAGDDGPGGGNGIRKLLEKMTATIEQ